MIWRLLGLLRSQPSRISLTLLALAKPVLAKPQTDHME